jgi:mono/diheme cytochrome c family protein
MLPSASGWIDDAAPGATASVDFSRDVRPILSENCFKCHGPDDAERKGKLRLDTREGALAARKGGAAVLPGKPDESLLIDRLTTDDPESRMPPRKTGKQLPPQQVATLRQWIREGAKWSEHWAFVAPRRPAVPQFSAGQQPRHFPLRNPIDHFVLARHLKQELTPAAEADRPTLIRRVALDLTGLPPTFAEIDAFLADTHDGAYDRLVERLLSSPRYGERMALEWLDAARFADTHGYHIDSGRDMSRWREWVIDAFNQNKPFDQFTVEQLAGDLLPNATMEQRIASGFNRNHMINFEGGAIPEEYHTAYIVDRVNTTSTIWLGLTVGCAQCHDHKYDPITQKEFYQLFAFFHNVPENGLDGSKGNAAPVLKAPSAAQQRQLDQLAVTIKRLEERLAAANPELDTAQREWEKEVGLQPAPTWTVWDVEAFESRGGGKLIKLQDQSLRAGGANPAKEVYTLRGVTPLKKPLTAVRVEVLPSDLPGQEKVARSANGNFVLTDVKAETLVTSQTGAGTPISIRTAWADFAQDGFPAANAIDRNANTGWAILPQVDKPHTAVFEFAQPIGLSTGTQLNLAFHFESQFTQHQWSRFRVSVTDAANPLGAAGLPEAVRTALSVRSEKRSPAQQIELRNHYRQHVGSATRKLFDELTRARTQQIELDRQLPTTMVMQEMGKPRDTFLLVRGQYDKKGEKVAAGVPAFLPALAGAQSSHSGAAPPNRLDLARWLVRPDHPLAARVTVNRYWQMYFGTGLVKTSEDFGSQGEQPSHPELLDWLATEFIRTGWDVKRLQKLIVTSSTYRQSSRFVLQSQADPENRLLARGPRFRLQAEFIRDQALAVSGLLNGEIGGHSVSPYQPPGLWEELMSRADGANWTAQTYKQSTGKELYRRTMYTFWKRTCPPPTLATFDAPDRETCTVRRARTNTPLQALILMNDPTYVEAARKLAERMMQEGGHSPESRIAFAFRLSSARLPTEKETALLRRVFDEQLLKYRKDRADAEKLLTVGEAKRQEKLDAAELAAWSVVANVILNLDEVVTRG